MHKAIAMPHGAMIARHYEYRSEDENDVHANANADRDANRDADRDTDSTTPFQSFDPLVESIDRRLARLRIQNETEVDDCDESADDAIYKPSDVVLRMHRAPRGIGNTNRLASLLVDPPNGGDNDYVGGLKLFCGFFIIAPFVIWLLVILFWKLRYDLCDGKRSRGNTSTSTSTSTAGEGEKGNQSSHAFDPFHLFHAFKSKLSQIKIIPTPKTATATASSTATVAATSGDANAKTRTPPTTVDPATTKSNSPASPPATIPLTPWVAGGGVIDMYQLSRAGVSRKERKRLVLRSWKLQSVFLSVSILIPVLSIVLLERGWKPLEKAALEVQELNNDVEALAYRGEHSIQLLESYKYKLFAENELVRSIVEYSHASIHTNTNTIAEPDPKGKPKMDGGDDDGSHGSRRAQWGWGWETGTSAPTLPITSDFDSQFFFPWSDMATSSPTEEEGPPVDKNDFNQKAPWKTDSTASPTALPWQEEEELNNFDEGANHTSTPLDAFFNHTTSSSTTPSILFKSGIFIDDWCPDAMKFLGIDELNYWADSINNLTEKTQGIRNIFYALETSFPSESSWSEDTVRDHSLSTPPATSSSAFKFVTDTTAYVDESIEWFLANDWLLKLLVLVLNVINGLLLANVYFISKNNVIHQPTRCYVALVLIPGFVIAVVFVVAVTVATGVGVLINSDFCSGGSDVGGPQGTIEDAILTLQEEQRSQGQVPNQALNLVYDAVDYYWTGCLTENPLEFLEDFSEELDDAVARINEFKSLLPVVDDFDLATNGMLSEPEQTGSSTLGNANTSTAAPPKISLLVLNKACQRDMSFLPPAIHDLKNQVDQIRSNIHMLSDTVSCGQVSPLFRRVSHGAVCVESPEGLAVLWGTSFGIAILCFVLLTVRAALYNSVKYKKRRPTKPRRIVEKEFDEYKEFMGKYYGEKITSEWKIDGIPLPPTKLELEFDDGIDLKGTFDTAKSTKESGSGDSREDDDSQNAGIFIRSADHEDSSYGSSYDSECSDDEKSSDSEHGDEQSSAIGSFLSETKSIAMQTIHSLRNVKSLLSASTRRANKNTLPSHVGNLYSNYNTSGDEEDELMDYGNEIFFDNKLDTAVSDIGNDEEEPMDYGNGILHSAVSDIDVDIDSDTHDGKSVANSISDASLYLPTPTSQSRNMRSKSAAPFDKKPKTILTLANDDDFSDEDGVNDEEDEILASHSKAMAKYSLTPTSTNSISVASPTAPRKPLSFLSRTFYAGNDGDADGNYSDEELNSLVRPKQLARLKSFRTRTPRDP